MDGRDIRPLLMPDRFRHPLAPFALLYSGATNEANAYREGPWKLHVRLISQTGDYDGFSASPEKPLLFQVEHDLGERYDRAAEQPERVKEMWQRMQALEKSLR
jgi:arylsulfatase